MSALQRIERTLTTDPAVGHFLGGSQHYGIPRSMLMRIIGAFLTRGQRDVWTDASSLVHALPHQPIVRNLEYVPRSGPVIFLPNHYERKDAVWVGWGAMALTTAVAGLRDQRTRGRMRWVMTDTWADCFIGPIHVNPNLLGWVLKGFGDVYGIIRMPAHDLPNHDAERCRSALSIRAMIAALRQGDCIAVHPEAGGFETLIHPPAGSGRVLTLLNGMNVPMIPVGVFEENDRLVLQIGEPIAPNSLRGMDDTSAADTVMRRIAALVPERTRGVFAEAPSA